MKSSHGILAFQVVAHLALAWVLFYGPLWVWGVALLAYAIGSCIGGTVTYHRLISHRAFNAPKWFQYLGPLIGTLNGAGSTIAWAATHRKHHRFTDTERDPHSPHHQPWWRVQWLSMLEKPEVKYVPDLLRSKYHVFLHKNYWFILTCWWLLLWAISWQVLFAVLAANALVWEAGSLINTVCHKWGYRNFETRERSTNNTLLGWLVFGEGWHNNHHARPSEASFSAKPSEVDLGGQFIRLIT